MTVLAFGSAKASPGVTTAVLALAAVWPLDHQVIVVELDPDGGDLSACFGLATEPGLVTLAAEGRRSLEPETVLRHLQPLPGAGQVQVLAAPPSAEQARAALGTLVSSYLRRCLADLEGSDVLLDCGRLTPGSPVLELLDEVDMTVLVTRPTLREIAHLRARITTLARCRLAVLLVGDRPYAPLDVAQALDADVVGVLADDPRGAAALTGKPAIGVRSRSALLRSAAPIVERLTVSAACANAPVDATIGELA